ncbi:Glutathione S-transferase BbdI (plasmid) [Aminobacter sp. MSH1]|uniref:glutathione S-transferase family protein n=1 Tax=Aminobacter sp. MSH1 TaxID=374606 RepID=UPI000D50552B|nr:glutathione S-transferase family protein [Aminobacter sp. MSH1]ARD70020.2 Glutathione S-transferase BbdI [Aminobacter sp. MSH1]ARD70023.2 Glutathione S-transferase BbdI [Aminobacter sp. MSH1]ARD70026.2 Glutathione S-transferase BbdI [Aminobacter sp. MSH1]AWC26098.1 Glutathione S-transferase BbdI [Aminobacter sp. MSH1]
MELYHNNMSACSQKVRVVLAEKNLKVVEHHLNLGAGDSHQPDYLKLNPNGVVPTLIDDDQVIIESSVICEYLDDTHPEVPLSPEDAVQRAHMRVWMLAPDAGLHGWISTLSFAIAWRHQDRSEQIKLWSTEVKAARMDLIENGLMAAAVKPQLKKVVQTLGKMGKALQHSSWLAGSTYSLADVALLPYVVRLNDMQMSWIWEESDKMEAIADWLARSQERSGYAGIADYLEPNSIEVMRNFGLQERRAIADLLGD